MTPNTRVATGSAGARAITEPDILTATQEWLRVFVVGENLCPFAKRVLDAEQIRFSVTQTDSEHELLGALEQELNWLVSHPDVETSLLIHPRVLSEFSDYNDFLAVVDEFLYAAGLEGVFQVASFHPDYQFADTAPEAAENFTNRSPYPMLHILREASVERAVAGHPDVNAIPERNIARMNSLGLQTISTMLARIKADH